MSEEALLYFIFSLSLFSDKKKWLIYNLEYVPLLYKKLNTYFIIYRAYMEIRILFLAANPSNASRLRLGQELRDIKEKLQLSKFRDKFVLESHTSARPGDISQAILDFKPNIVHFSGHGTAEGELCFEDELGQIKPVTSKALAALFKLMADEINCVVLNACYSDIQAQAIAEHISCVVGMKKAIGDKAAIAFAVGFYKALGADETVERAYEFGCAEIGLENIPEELTPVLRKKK